MSCQRNSSEVNVLELTFKPIPPERLAVGICHAIYRNTVVEDFHSENRLMDQAFYREVYQKVTRKIDLLLGTRNMLVIACTSGIAELLPESKLPNTREEIRFFADVIYGILCGSEWDDPVEIEEPPGEDLAGYLLGGTFKAFCDGKQHLDDSVMKPINKDITNRAYRILKEIILANN